MHIEKSLKVIDDASILKPKQLRQLSELKTELQLGFTKRQLGRPKYLMNVSVLKDMKFPTPDAKYWQCILERDIQFHNLVTLSYDFKEKQAEIEIKQAEIEELNGELTNLAKAKIKKLQIQIEREETNLVFMKKEASERVREIMAWTELIREVEPKLKYSKDDPEAHMPESFLLRFAHQKKILAEIGASDMNGAMNIIALGETAAKYWRELGERYESQEEL